MLFLLLLFLMYPRRHRPSCSNVSFCPQVVYEDGDTEDLNWAELEPVLVGEVKGKEANETPSHPPSPRAHGTRQRRRKRSSSASLALPETTTAPAADTTLVAAVAIHTENLGPKTVTDAAERRRRHTTENDACVCYPDADDGEVALLPILPQAVAEKKLQPRRSSLRQSAHSAHVGCHQNGAAGAVPGSHGGEIDGVHTIRGEKRTKAISDAPKELGGEASVDGELLRGEGPQTVQKRVDSQKSSRNNAPPLKQRGDEEEEEEGCADDITVGVNKRSHGGRGSNTCSSKKRASSQNEVRGTDHSGRRGKKKQKVKEASAFTEDSVFDGSDDKDREETTGKKTSKAKDGKVDDGARISEVHVCDLHQGDDKDTSSNSVSIDHLSMSSDLPSSALLSSTPSHSPSLAQPLPQPSLLAPESATCDNSRQRYLLSCISCDRLDLPLETDPNTPGTYYCAPCFRLLLQERNAVTLSAGADTTTSAKLPEVQEDGTPPLQEDDGDEDHGPQEAHSPICNAAATRWPGGLTPEEHAAAVAAVKALAQETSAPRAQRARTQVQAAGHVDVVLQSVVANDLAGLASSLLGRPVASLSRQSSSATSASAETPHTTTTPSTPTIEALLVCMLLPWREEYSELILARNGSLAVEVVSDLSREKVLQFLSSTPLTCDAVANAVDFLCSLASLKDGRGWTCLHFACAITSDGGRARLIAPLVIAAAHTQNQAWRFVRGNRFVPRDGDSADGSSGGAGEAVGSGRILTRVHSRFDHRGLAPLHIATSRGSSAAVEGLLNLRRLSDGTDAGSSSTFFDTLLRCRGGFTALHWCCSPQDEGVPADTLKAKSRSGMAHGRGSVKPAASLSAQAACAELLLSAAPELFDAVDRDGRTALDWATEDCDDEECEDRGVLDVLLQHERTRGRKTKG